MFSQDTIRFSDGELRAIEIVEVTSFGVKYYHFNNPQSKLLFAAKKDISFIKYQNGEIDSLKKKVKPLAIAGEEKNLQNPVLAYDTIVFRTGQKKVVKVTEVGTADIKYKPVDYTEGPAYAIEKSKIKCIKYSNGITDSFPEVKAQVNSSPLKIKPIDPANEKVDIIGNRLVFREHALDEKDLLYILSSLKEGEKKSKMLESHKEMRKYKSIQHAFGLVTLGGAVVAAYTGGASSFITLLGGIPPTSFVIVFAASGVFSITTGVISARFKKKRTAKKIEFAHIFNE